MDNAVKEKSFQFSILNFILVNNFNYYIIFTKGEKHYVFYT